VPTAQTTAPETRQRQGATIAPSNGQIPVYTPKPLPAPNGTTPVVAPAPENGAPPVVAPEDEDPSIPLSPDREATAAEKTKENGKPVKPWYAKPTTWALAGVGAAIIIGAVVYARR
jgi:hypothetical protein